MTRKLPCGIQYNLYVPNHMHDTWMHLCKEADRRGMSPGKLICEILKQKYRKPIDE